MVPPSINSNRNSLTADALRQFRKHLPSSAFDNTTTTKRNSPSKADKVLGSRFQTQMRLEFKIYKFIKLYFISLLIYILLHVRLMENNYEERELTPGDGSCLAHALIDQMTLDPILSLTRIDHHQFRKLVVNSLPQMIRNGNIEWHFNIETQYGIPTHWMNQALVPNSYLDHIFLELASNVLNRRIRVLHVIGGHILDFAPRTTTGKLFFLNLYNI